MGTRGNVKSFAYRIDTPDVIKFTNRKLLICFQRITTHSHLVEEVVTRNNGHTFSLDPSVPSHSTRPQHLELARSVLKDAPHFNFLAFVVEPTESVHIRDIHISPSVLVLSIYNRTTHHASFHKRSIIGCGHCSRKYPKHVVRE